MSRQPITKAIWKTMMWRYGIASAIGLLICIFFFNRLYYLHAGEAIPSWLIAGASVGGLMLLGGLFGMSISLLFHLGHKE